MREVFADPVDEESWFEHALMQRDEQPLPLEEVDASLGCMAKESRFGVCQQEVVVIHQVKDAMKVRESSGHEAFHLLLC